MTPQRQIRQSPRSEAVSDNPRGSIFEDHVCPVCHLLLFEPVRTRCNHLLCASCMAQWADVSVTSQMSIVSLEDKATTFDPVQVEANCPMCRSRTTASLDVELAEQLRSRYHLAYAEREAEERWSPENGIDGPQVETVTLDIGNEHRMVQRSNGSINHHEWTFFVRPSRTDIIEEVQMILHPTFGPMSVIQRRPPYRVTKLGWGVFTIAACIVLRPGYSWVSADAETINEGGSSRSVLTLRWDLDFDRYDGKGSMGRCRVKVRGRRLKFGRQVRRQNVD